MVLFKVVNHNRADVFGWLPRVVAAPIASPFKKILDLDVNKGQRNSDKIFSQAHLSASVSAFL